MAEILRLNEVVKRVVDGRARRTIVDNVSFGVETGQVVVLRGPSGSGKTTLLALIGVMMVPTSGEVLIGGEPTSRLRDTHRAEVRRHKVGFVFQDAQLIGAMSSHENVLLPRLPDGLRPGDERRATELLERFGIGPTVRNAPARGLSGGEQQRVALARALINDARLLLLDEPTAHLDDARVREVAKLIDELAHDGRAVVVATHDPRLSSAVTSPAILDMVDGRISPSA
jgi:putative ABC transport system ATP-binding protein